MGQKVNPYGLRNEILIDWESKWYPEEQVKSKKIKNKIKYYISKKIDVKWFLRKIMQKIKKRLILPRQKLA